MSEEQRTQRTPEERAVFNRAVIRARRHRFQTYKGDMELQAVGQAKPDFYSHYEWENGVFHPSRTFFALNFPTTWQDAGSQQWFGTCPTCGGDGIFKGRNAKADDDTHDGRNACWTCKRDKTPLGFIALPAPSTLKLQAMVWVAEKLNIQDRTEGVAEVLRVAKSEYAHCNKMIKKDGKHAMEHAMLKFWQIVGQRCHYLLADDGVNVNESFLTTEWSVDFRVDVGNVLSFSKWARSGMPSWLAICFMKAERARSEA